MTAYLRGPAAITLIATAESVTHVFAAAAATTANWAEGLYAYSVRATKDAEVHEVASGQIKVLPNIAAITTPYDGRSENEKALEAIDAVLGKRATIDQDRYRINNRELWRTPVADLLKLRSYYATKVRQEKARKRGCSSTLGRQIPVRFS